MYFSFLILLYEIFLLLLFLLLILLLVSYLTSVIYGAPFVPINKKYIKEMLLFGGLKSNDVIYDFGSGDGRVLFTAIKEFNVLKAVGYEISFLPYIFSKILIKIKNLENKIFIKRKNFLKDNDFKEATFIYMYLFPEVIDKLAYQINKFCKKNIKILSVDFKIDLNKHHNFKLIKQDKIGRYDVFLYENL
jgi:hypothetical protein